MTPKSRVLIVLIALLLGGIAVVFAYRLADGIFRARMAENYESKRIHVSSGKVLTVSATESEVPKGGTAEGPPRYKICFSIDSFSDIPNDLREEYSTAEKARILKNAPECIITTQASLPSNLKEGEAIDVYFLLYGQGVITVERLVVSGQDINAS